MRTIGSEWLPVAGVAGKVVHECTESMKRRRRRRRRGTEQIKSGRKDATEIFKAVIESRCYGKGWAF